MIVVNEEPLVCFSVRCELQILYKSVSVDTQRADRDINSLILGLRRHIGFLLNAENLLEISQHRFTFPQSHKACCRNAGLVHKRGIRCCTVLSKLGLQRVEFNVSHP